MSDSPSFTPGPWSFKEIDPNDKDWGACEVTDEQDRLVATHVWGTASAALIAASPELYEALKSLLFIRDNVDETGYVTDVGFYPVEQEVEKARAALAKATATAPTK